MALVLLSLFGLVRAGSQVRAPRPQGTNQMSRSAGRASPSSSPWPGRRRGWPRASSPALLHQDYPDYQVIFTTRDLQDPATGVIAKLIWGKPRARLVVAGPARTRGQKNQNLLAGIRLAGDAPEILAFCDSNQEAPRDFLRKLAAPVALGEGVVTSGYHQAIPGDRRLATWGRAVSVLTLYLTKAVPWLNQPWGGATAIRRETFESLGVASLWTETVVDDVSLAALLIRARIPVRLWIYLKYYLPGSWMAAGVLMYSLTGLTLASLMQLLLAPWGWGAPRWLSLPWPS